MSLPLFLQGLGSIGVFASRAFLPAFVTALLLRFGPQVPWLAHAGLLPHVRDVPTWFTSDAALVVLGLLAALELVAERFPEAKVVLDEVHDYLKTGHGGADVPGRPQRHGAGRRRAGDPSRPGCSTTCPVLAVGAGVYLASLARGAVLGPLSRSGRGRRPGAPGAHPLGRGPLGRARAGGPDRLPPADGRRLRARRRRPGADRAAARSPEARGRRSPASTAGS